jgi:hypothetical protein
MIVGESSYDPYATREGFDFASQTMNVGNDAIGYEEGRGYWNKSKFYTRIARMFGYDYRSFSQRKLFWESVVYYNFLQVVLTKAREIPPAKAWSESVSAFRETLEEHRPDFVVSFSKRMWPHIPKDSGTALYNELGVDCRSGYIALTDGHSVRMINFLHPTSFGFRWQPVGLVLRSFMHGEAEQGAAGQPLGPFFQQ